MKYIFTIFFTAFVFCNANSQTYPWLGNFYNEIPTNVDLWDSSMAANHYRSMTRTLHQYNKKGALKKRSDTFAFTYDDKGFLTTLYETNSKNKKSEKYDYVFKDSMIMGYNYYKNGKLFRSYEITRNSNKKITDMVKKNSKGGIILKQHTDFDDVGKMLTRIAYYDKNNKEKKAIEYSYHEDNTMKQAKEYRKGKLKRVWNYTCDPKGADEKKVKEMKVCKNVNVDENGNRVESNRIVNPKGEVELRVNTFDKNERFIKQKVYDDIKHKLKSEFSTTIVNGNEETVYKNYDKKEKLIMVNTSVYNSSHKLINHEYAIGKKLKRAFKTVFEYNEKNLLINSKSFDSKDRKTYENIHTYN
jgi:hypothetical protein